MITSRCPVRISVAGGSTDLDSFILQYGRGSVVSFSTNLYTYITVFRDKFGQNALEKLYNVCYSTRESVTEASLIKNDLARVVIEKFKCEPLSCWFTADVSSAGSGLASSSSYMLSFINSINELESLGMTKDQVIQQAWDLERAFNPLTGYQDPYGCATGGLNVHTKVKNGPVVTKPIETNVFDGVKMYLLPSKINRNSTVVLEQVKKTHDARLIKMADEMVLSLESNNLESFVDIVREGWKIKKESSPVVVGNDKLKELDEKIENDKRVLAHRLIGAGNGGYFLLVTKDLALPSIVPGLEVIPVGIDNEGLKRV